MKTKEEILKETTKRTLNVNEGSPLHDAVMKAMEEYAQQQVKNCSIPAVELSLPDEDEINSMRLEMDCLHPNEEEYTTAGFKSGVRWLKNTIERQLQGQ